MQTGGILALDLATVLGFAYGPPAPDRLPLAAVSNGGHWQPDSGSYRVARSGTPDGVFFQNFRDWLRPMLVEREPSIVVWEAPILGGRKMNRNVVYRLTGLAAVCDLTCQDFGVPRTNEVAPSSIKKHATGKGNATKDMMQDAALMMGWAFGDDNEVDAIWLHSYASAILAQQTILKGAA